MNAVLDGVTALSTLAAVAVAVWSSKVAQRDTKRAQDRADEAEARLRQLEEVGTLERMAIHARQVRVSAERASDQARVGSLEVNYEVTVENRGGDPIRDLAVSWFEGDDAGVFQIVPEGSTEGAPVASLADEVTPRSSVTLPVVVTYYSGDFAGRDPYIGVTFADTHGHLWAISPDNRIRLVDLGPQIGAGVGVPTRLQADQGQPLER